MDSPTKKHLSKTEIATSIDGFRKRKLETTALVKNAKKIALELHSSVKDQIVVNAESRKLNDLLKNIEIVKAKRKHVEDNLKNALEHYRNLRKNYVKKVQEEKDLVAKIVVEEVSLDFPDL